MNMRTEAFLKVQKNMIHSFISGHLYERGKWNRNRPVKFEYQQRLSVDFYYNIPGSCTGVLSTCHALSGKPYTEEELVFLIDEIHVRDPAFGEKTDSKSNGSDLQIPFKTIVHADHFFSYDPYSYNKRKRTCHPTVFGTFTAPLKEDSRFFICNRGTIINMEHAVDFDGTMFLLDDGSKIVVSRELCKPARQHFMDYLFKGGILMRILIFQTLELLF